MELENIKTQTKWSEAAESINSNNLKIVTEVTKLQSATYKNKGYFKTLSDLQSAFPTAAVGSKAYVGLSYPYAIYLWENNSWVDSGATGGEESVKLDQFYTKDETDTKLATLSEKVDNVTTEEAVSEEEDIVFQTDEGAEVGRITPNGAEFKALRVAGAKPLTPDYYPIEKEETYSFDLEDEIVLESEGKPIARINKNGIYANDFHSINGNSLSGFETIDIANSDKIGVFSTSFMNGYAMKNHHHLNHLSLFLDYIIYNYGHSGDDEIENLARLQRDEKWLGDIAPSEWNIKYGIVMHEQNSAALRAMDEDSVYYNSKMLANAIKSLGGIPIFSTEHDDNYSYYQGAIRLCQEEGYMFMNWGKATNQTRCVYNPFWYNGHPATRTGWLITLGMLPYLQSLPRPEKCIKLFRVRDGVDTTDINSNLMYYDFYTRAQKFVELTCGQSGLTQATEKYFDRLDVGGTYQTIKDEYQTLQNGGAVSFGEILLAEFITPYTRDGLEEINVSIKGSGITNAYVKKINKLANPISEKRYQAFGIIKGEDAISVGSTITISGITREDGSGLNREYIVQGVTNGMLITTTLSSTAIPFRSSGVDTPLCNIEGVVLKGSYDYPSMDYVLRYNKPTGEWVEVTIDDSGNINLNEFITTSMDFDKIAILLKGKDISIQDIRAKVAGTKRKIIHTIPMTEYKKGISVIADTKFDNDTLWSGVSDLTTYDNNKTSTPSGEKEPLPTGISTVKELSKGESTQQAVDIIDDSHSPQPTKVQIRVLARFFPEYINSDAKWESSEINEQSFDMARLAIILGGAKEMKVAELNVGAWWYEYVVETYCTSAQTNYIKLSCTDKKVQIAKCEIDII